MFRTLKLKWYLERLKKRQSQAAEALGKLGDARAVEPLILALRDKDVLVRRASAEALGKLGDARAVEPLAVALVDHWAAVRRTAAESLGKMGHLQWAQLVTGADEDFAQLGSSKELASFELLIRAMGDNNADRRGVMQALSKSHDVRAVAPLIRALEVGEKDDRIAAAEALCDLGDARAVEPLIRALEDRDGGVCRATAEALLKLGDERAVELLKRRMPHLRVEPNDAYSEPNSYGRVFEHLVFLLRGDDLVEAHSTNPGGNESHLSVSVPQGDYIVVYCDIGNLPGSRVGISRVEARKVLASASLEFKEFCYLYKRVPDNSLFRPSGIPLGLTVKVLPTTDLTARQCATVVETIARRCAPWMWNNAPREVKLALQARFSCKDEARELLDRGTDKASTQQYEEARKLIETALGIDTNLVGAREQLGKIAIELGHVSEAIDWFKKEVGLAATEEAASFESLAYLAVIYQEMGSADVAEAYAQAAIQTNAYKRVPRALDGRTVEKIRLVVESLGSEG